MYEARYLLSIEELIKEVPEQDLGQGSAREALFQRAFFRVDEERREKARRMRTARARAACLGGGLLLQLAVGEAVRAGSAGSFYDLGRYSVTELLERLEDLPYFPLAYRYGENGKPYFRDFPLQFNLSHSGNYVLCAVSEEEIGADIQQHCGKNVEKISGRFFSKREAEAIAAEQAGEEREKLFYRLWARKEAYGKLTGKGIAGVLETELLPREAQEPQGSAGLKSAHIDATVLPNGRRLLWEEFILTVAKTCQVTRLTSGKQHILARQLNLQYAPTANFTAYENDIMKEMSFNVENYPEDNYNIAFCQFGI